MITWATRCSAGDREGRRPRARTAVDEDVMDKIFLR
jgi:hypothetical protein